MVLKFSAVLILMLSAVSAAVSGAPRLERVSVGDHGQSGNAASRKAAMTPDGRYVVFLSAATNLTSIPVPAGNPQWYLRDRVRRTTRLISKDASGFPMSGISVGASQNWANTAHAVISSEGRTILFDAYAPLLSADQNGRADIYQVRDGLPPELIPTPEPVGTYVYSALLGSDGSQGRLLTHCPPPWNGGTPAGQLCLLERSTGTYKLLSGTPSGEPFLGSLLHPYLSRDGRFVLFDAAATDLVEPPLFSFRYHVYLRDLTLGYNRIVSVGPVGEPIDASAGSMSSDGRYISYVANGNTLPEPTLPDTYQQVRFDRIDGSYMIVSRGENSAQVSSTLGLSGMSGDGRFVVFETLAPELNPFLALFNQYYRVNVETGVIEMISVNADGVPALPSADPMSRGLRPMSPVLSENGSVIAFTTAASNLVVGDSNGVDDVYVADFNLPMATQAVSLSATAEGLATILLTGIVVIALLAGRQRSRYTS